MWGRVRGGVGGRRSAAHVRGQSPGQSGEDGLGSRANQRPFPPNQKLQQELETLLLKHSGLFIIS